MTTESREHPLAATLSRWRTETYRNVMLPGAPGTTTAREVVDAIDALADALRTSRATIQEDRDEIFDAVTVAGIEATMDEIDRPSVERMDAVLREIDAALAKVERFQ